MQVNCASGDCTTSDRDGVNFLHSSLLGAAFWICDPNNVDSTPVF